MSKKSSFLITILFACNILMISGDCYGGGLFSIFGQSKKAEPIFEPDRQEALKEYLNGIADWIIKLDLGSGILKNTDDTNQSIFINGNLARVLISAYQFSGDEKYLKEAVHWTDRFCNQQQLTITSKFNQGGFWPDFPRREKTLYANIYFGDMGTAATSLSVIYEHVDAKRQKIYLECLKRMAAFVIEGSMMDPQFQGRDFTDSFIIKSGEHKGALGCGYYRGHLSMEPYSISTGTTGGAFMSQMYKLTKDKRYNNISKDAVAWLLKIRKPHGEVPYTLDGKEFDTWPLDTMTYSVEAFVSVHRFMNAAEKRQFANDIRVTIDWLVETQNADGTWGELRSHDQQRSPGLVTLLNWYYREVQQDEKVKNAVRSYCLYLLEPENSAAYGVKELVRTTGFVGITISEVLEPNSTF